MPTKLRRSTWGPQGTQATTASICDLCFYSVTARPNPERCRVLAEDVHMSISSSNSSPELQIRMHVPGVFLHLCSHLIWLLQGYEQPHGHGDINQCERPLPAPLTTRNLFRLLTVCLHSRLYHLLLVTQERIFKWFQHLSLPLTSPKARKEDPAHVSSTFGAFSALVFSPIFCTGPLLVANTAPGSTAPCSVAFWNTCWP